MTVAGSAPRSRAAKPKPDATALIAAGKRRTDTFRACMDPDLVGAYEILADERERLVEERDSKQQSARDSLAGKADTGQVDAQIADVDKELAALDARIEAVTVVLTLEALPRAEFRAMVDRHPPRKDAEGKLTHPGRDQFGVAYEPFMDELLRASITDPQLDPETLDLLLDERLTDRDWERLTEVAWLLNRAVVSVPFSPAASTKTRGSSKR